MLKNLILSAAAAGVAAGLLTAVIQHVTTTPIIIEAEKYEGGAAPHDHGARSARARATPPLAVAPAAGDAMMQATPAEVAEEWAPADGIEAHALYVACDRLSSAFGFGLALLGAMALAGVRYRCP